MDRDSRGDPELIRPTFDRWLAYFREQEIEAVGTGLITLRRRTTERNWFRIATAPDKIGYPAGDEIQRIFARRDFLESTSDDLLLESAIRLAPGVQLLQEANQEGNEWVVTASHLRRTEGFEYSGGIDPDGATLLARCDGQATLRELVADLTPGSGISRDQLEQGVAAIIRELMERRFVVPPAGA